MKCGVKLVKFLALFYLILFFSTELFFMGKFGIRAMKFGVELVKFHFFFFPLSFFLLLMENFAI